jgi:serine/threonine-protein kinase
VTAVAQRRGPAPAKERTLGRYRLGPAIASGGMGTVHLAHSAQHGIVAIKLLHPHLASERRFVAMFFEEARLAARISHRNVVEVFDVEQIDGEYLIAMRYVAGGSLARVLVKDAKVEPRVAMRIVHDVLLGLHAAHEATTSTANRSRSCIATYRHTTCWSISTGLLS